jgi:hypothetical protein
MYASVVVAGTFALLDVATDGWPGFDLLLLIPVVVLYVFPITLVIGLPIHLAFAAMRIQSGASYMAAGLPLGATTAVVFFRGSGLAWLSLAALGFAAAGGVAAFTFWRSYVDQSAGRLTSG